VEAYNCDDMMYKWVYNMALVVTGLDDWGIFWGFTVCQNLGLECNIWFLLLQKHTRSVKTDVFFISGFLWLQQVFVFYESLSSLRVLLARVSLDISINLSTDFPPRTPRVRRLTIRMNCSNAPFDGHSEMPGKS
jgi:hypothetical protein